MLFRSSLLRPCWATAVRTSALSGLLPRDANSGQFLKNEKFYNGKINLNAAAALVEGSDIVYASAALDVSEQGTTFQGVDEYLHHVKDKAGKWFKKEELCDRGELLSTVDDLIESKGRFSLILGGKSTGKSFMLEYLRRQNSNVLRINMRQFAANPDLAMALLDVLKQFPGERYPAILTKVMESAGLTVTGSSESLESVEAILSKFEKAMADRVVNENALLPQLLEALGADATYTLVIDEANLAFDKNFHDRETVDKMIASLKVLTQFTKEKQKVPQLFSLLMVKVNWTNCTVLLSQVNVILASSDHSFASKLADLGFNMFDITSVIIAGEISPDKMYELLTQEWGLRTHLAEALMDIFGGHIWDTFWAINQLNHTKKDFFPRMAFDMMTDGSIHECLNFEQGSPADRLRMAKILECLALNGFAPLGNNPVTDAVARMLSEKNIGGVVASNSTVVGLPANTLRSK
jgi:hypothetical protein